MNKRSKNDTLLLLQVMKRSPVLSAYREAGLIDTFPLHDDEILSRCYTGSIYELLEHL